MRDEPRKAPGSGGTAEADLLTVAVPTGRLFAESVSLLRRAGVLGAAPEASNPSQERSLLLPAAEGLILAVKPADIPVYVEHGAADAGIVGRDVLLEQGGDVYELVDLGFGSCRGVVAVRKGEEDDWPPVRTVRVATKYPRIAARYWKRRGWPAEIIALNGAVELAPRVGLADAVLDVVVTGRTLRDNLLVEVAEVFRSTARLVVNRASLRMKSRMVQRLIAALEGLKT
ncbi:MAG: ATP phosphoribosyltransferase [Armatimonadota bacterium]|nr:ATP phosphoribosyltransferase [Armatimonadota bacterium]MDR7427736.1 ATP phosphoribosyltransferase [Armatimonadota bacterium]MDR7464627.1 ATP phosphoribosyltransferase [Armatimonadota bacterium]MDR7469647.1 ATP phosphoribosyltransferase [Armatimonadota bacterium]MDR7474922.1 ATP phosphoribosyltransferase [Armatimonadota bacterium]